MSDDQTLLVVCPVLDEQITDRCIESVLRKDSAFGVDLQDILLVDNSRDGFASKYGLRTYRDPMGHNLGVARAWNVGAREVLDKKLDYLVILSTSMVFGPQLHTTWRKQMETFWGAHVIECDGHSWHLIALHRRLFERIGIFDGNFYPAYEESIDFGYRMRVTGLEVGFIHVWVNAMSQGAAMHTPFVDCPNKPLRDYYFEKWGGEKGNEKWVQPYGAQDIGYFDERPIPELAERYGLKEWW